MKQKTFLLIITVFVLSLFLVACGGAATPEPTVVSTEEPKAEPTAAPTEEPTVDSSELEEEATMADLTALVEHPWQWASFTNPASQFEVESPESYVLTFNSDGTVSVKADCNNASGSYTADGSSLTIEIGPMTMAACPEGSLSDQFVQLLGGAALYFFEEGDLYIDLMADGGTMAFTPASAEAMADDGEGAIVDTAEEQPFGAGIYWQLSSLTDPVNGELIIDESELYSLSMADGTAILSTACRFAVGSYELDGSALALTYDLPEKSDENCAEGPNGDRYFQLLQGTANYFTENGRLLIDLMADGGTLTFTRYDPAELAQKLMRVESWDEVLANVLASQACAAPGGVLLVDTPQGRFLKAQGVASSEDGTPITAADAFEIGSNTKSFTTVVALQLQEEGVWSLDDPLQMYLPEQAAKLPYGDQVTLRQLAQNQSGIPDYADAIIGDAIVNNNLEKGYTPEELIDYVAENLEPSFGPGQGWEYSTTNFILLGMAIEAVTGQSLAELYEERIFAPLEMTNSYLLEGVPEEGQIVQGYYTLDDGEVMNVTAWNGSQGWAGGGNISTVEDMAKYAAGIASGALFQDPTSLEQLLAFGDGAVGLFAGYGLGVGRWSEDPIVWGHEGQTPGFQTMWAVYPDQESRVVFLTNSGSCSVAPVSLGIINASPDLFTQELP